MDGAQDWQSAADIARARIAAYRRNALECLDEVQNAAIDSAARTIFYSMAQEWLRLAAKTAAENSVEMT